MSQTYSTASAETILNRGLRALREGRPADARFALCLLEEMRDFGAITCAQILSEALRRPRPVAQSSAAKASLAQSCLANSKLGRAA